MPGLKRNPYVEGLEREVQGIRLSLGGSDPAVDRAIAQYIVEQLITPKNRRIHELASALQELQSQITRLGTVLERHNAGEWHKDKEEAIDCAIRLLSPVPDNAPPRDRP